MTLATVRPEKSMSDALHPERYTFGSVRIAARSAAVGEPLAAPAGAASASAAISDGPGSADGRAPPRRLLLASTAPRDRAKPPCDWCWTPRVAAANTWSRR